MQLQGGRVLTTFDIEKIFSLALQLLATEGCSFDARDREVLVQSGAIVGKNNRIKIPVDILKDRVEELQASYTRSDKIRLVMGQADMLQDPVSKKSRTGEWKDCQKILALAESLPNIYGITWGVEPKDVPDSQRLAIWTGILEKYAKPFCLPEISEEMLALVLEQVSTESTRLLGTIRPSYFFQYAHSELQKIRLYSQKKQPIYFQSNYHPNLGLALPDILCLQTAEILAGIFYAFSLESTSPLFLLAGNPKDYIAENDFGNIWDVMLYDIATIQIGHHLGLGVAIPNINKPNPNFIHGSIMVAERFFTWLASAEELWDVGTVSKSLFHPLYLCLENDWLEFWQQSFTSLDKGIPVDIFIKKFQEGKTPDKMPIWQSEFLCYDETQNRKVYGSFPQKIREQFKQKWESIAIELPLDERS